MTAPFINRETELSFLATFHLRFRKAIEDYRSRQESGEKAVPPPSTPPPRAEVKPGAQVEPPPPAVEPVAPPDPEPPRIASEETTDEIFSPPPDQPGPPPTREAPEPQTPAAEPIPEPAPDPSTAGEVQPQELTFEDALDAGDNQIILRELYKEVTTIAEGIWTKDIPPPAKIWLKVSVSTWYEERFSVLGLRPISDFYDIINKVDRRMREGSTKEQLQNYLKEANFAQILLALRDMFQKNHI